MIPEVLSSLHTAIRSRSCRKAGSDGYSAEAYRKTEDRFTSNVSNTCCGNRLSNGFPGEATRPGIGHAIRDSSNWAQGRSGNSAECLDCSQAYGRFGQSHHSGISCRETVYYVPG